MKKCHMKQPTQKLVKGVIYDDICKKEVVDYMLEEMDETASSSDEEVRAFLDESPTMSDLSVNDFRKYATGMDAITALTRYNFETGVNHNLIIPKECLSRDLVEELEVIDLGKDLMSAYTHKFIDEYVSAEDFCGREEECLLKHVDKQDKNRIRCFIDGKKVSEDEMYEFLKDKPEAEIIPFIKALNGTISCF